MLLVYNYVFLKMSTWYSKHVEESNNILRINNIQCITLVILYGQQFFCHKGADSVVDMFTRFWARRLKNRGSITVRGKSFLCSKIFRPSLAAHWASLFSGHLPGAFSPGVNHQIEINEMGGTYSTYRGEERCVQGFGGETRGKETNGETQA